MYLNIAFVQANGYLYIQIKGWCSGCVPILGVPSSAQTFVKLGHCVCSFILRSCVRRKQTDSGNCLSRSFALVKLQCLIVLKWNFNEWIKRVLCHSSLVGLFSNCVNKIWFPKRLRKEQTSLCWWDCNYILTKPALVFELINIAISCEVYHSLWIDRLHSYHLDCYPQNKRVLERPLVCLQNW